jgi:hypothetical protein
MRRKQRPRTKITFEIDTRLKEEFLSNVPTGTPMREVLEALIRSYIDAKRMSSTR